MSDQYFVYIMSNRPNGVLYTGITNDLRRRVGEHREGIGSRFAAKYSLDRLVYYEIFKDAYNAIAREKQLKAGPRRKKVALVEKMNPEWRDLSGEL